MSCAHATYSATTLTMMEKSIDFDQVADLYDVFVRVDFDIEFWKEEARAAAGTVLELMCGTGRIGQPLVEAGVPYTGLDYCQKQLDQFQKKLDALSSTAKLVFGDARNFELLERFDLAFIGFSSLSEVLQLEDRSRVLQHVRAHLKPSGRFAFSLHNPATRSLSLDGEKSETLVCDFEDGQRTLEFCSQFRPPSSEGIVSGKQFYVIKDQRGRTLDEREQDVQFHLVTKEEIESLVANNGFRVRETWGDYDRSEFTAASPHMIYRCTV